MNYPSVFSLIRRHSLPSLGGDYSRDIRGIVESLHKRLIVVFGSTNTLIYFKDGEPLFQTECVTSKEGFGNESDSHCTPTGLHLIDGSIGTGCDKYQKFKARIPTTIETPPKPGKFKFGTYGRILTLDGVETQNQSTKDRLIYIHGNIHNWYWTDPEKNLRRSWGCIGLKLDEMVELFDLVNAVKEQVFVYIIGDK